MTLQIHYKNNLNFELKSEPAIFRQKKKKCTNNNFIFHCADSLVMSVHSQRTVTCAIHTHNSSYDWFITGMQMSVPLKQWLQRS